MVHIDAQIMFPNLIRNHNNVVIVGGRGAGGGEKGYRGINGDRK